jgi:hypothetical protein
MSKLTTKQRAKLPKKDFAGPGRSFPLNDRSHDLAAIIDVGRALKAGHISAAEAASIRAEAKKKLDG